MWLLSIIGITCIFAVYSASIPEELSLEQPKIDKNDNLTIPNNQNMFDILLEEVPDEHDARFNDSFTKFDQIDTIPVPEDLTRVVSETKAAAEEPLLTISPVSVTSSFAPNLAVDQAISSATIAELPSLVDDFTNMFEPIKAPSPIIPTRILITTRPFVTVLTTPAPPATTEPSTTATLLSTTSSVPITEFTTANPSTEEFTTEAIPAPTTDLLVTTVAVSATTAEPSTTATLLSTPSFTPTESSSATEGPTTEEQATEVPPVPTTELPTTEGKTSAETTEIFETRKFPTDDVTTEPFELPATEFGTEATTQATTTDIPTSTTTHAAVTTEILSTTQATTTIEIPTSTMHQTTTPDAIPSTTDTELPVTSEPTNGSIVEDEDTTKTVTVWALDEAKTTTAKPRLSRPWIPQASRLRPTTERVFIIHAEVPSKQNNTISAHNATVQVEGLSSAQKTAIRKFLDAKRHNASVIITSTTPIPTIRPTTAVPLAVTKPNPGTGFINPVITNPTQQAVPALFPQARPVFPFTNFQTFPNQRPVLPFQPLQTNFLPNTANAQNSFFPGR